MRYLTADAARRYAAQMAHPIARVLTAGERRAVRAAVADLAVADPSRADLAGADLSGADLAVADPSRADLAWADDVDRSWVDLAAGPGRLAVTVPTRGWRARRRTRTPAAVLAGPRVAMDTSAAMLALDRSGDPGVVADGRHLPLAADAVAVVVVLRLLHRCSDEMVVRVLEEALRVARRGAVISDVTPSPAWRQTVRRGLGRGPAPPGRAAGDLANLVALAGGEVVGAHAVLPVLSGGHVVAVRRASS